MGEALYDLVPCPDCGGEGTYDTGGSTPWGEWIERPCGRCKGEGVVPIYVLTEEEIEWLSKQPKQP